MSQSLPTSLSASALDDLCMHTLRFLAVDTVHKADRVPPGLPMAAAPMAHVLWKGFLKHRFSNPAWPDRGCCVHSARHGSLLRYSLPHGVGYDFLASIRSAVHTFRWQQPRGFSGGPPSIFKSLKTYF